MNPQQPITEIEAANEYLKGKSALALEEIFAKNPKISGETAALTIFRKEVIWPWWMSLILDTRQRLVLKWTDKKVAKYCTDKDRFEIYRKSVLQPEQTISEGRKVKPVCDFCKDGGHYASFDGAQPCPECTPTIEAAAKRVKLTKSALNNFISWTSTRYNDWLGYGTKKQNVERVLKAIQEGGEKGQKVFEIQSASPTGENPHSKAKYWKTKTAGGTYIIDCENRTITEKYSGRKISFLPHPAPQPDMSETCSACNGEFQSDISNCPLCRLYETPSTPNMSEKKSDTPVRYRAKEMHGDKIIVSKSIWEQPQRYGCHLHLYVQDGDEEIEDTGWVWVERNTLTIIGERITREQPVSKEAIKDKIQKVFYSQPGDMSKSRAKDLTYEVCEWLQSQNNTP